ncbi:uncharacterized protein [Miscanthus floridulus]|uniref:uncharacterized protein n=1 Tax=Miscanthus floridulus TaxID=154761 RepID=UPI0034578CAC
MEEGEGSKNICVADTSGVHVEDVSSRSELSMSTASDATIKEPKTTDAERRKARKERKAAKIATREAREKKKEGQRLKDKKKRKEARRITREARDKRRAARAQEQEKNEYDASSSEFSSSSDDRDDNVSYHASKDGKEVKSKDKKKDGKDKGSNNNKNKYATFVSKGQEGTDRSTQKVAQDQPRAAPQPMGGSAAVKGGSATPHRKGKTTSYSSAHVKPKKKVSLPE